MLTAEQVKSHSEVFLGKDDVLGTEATKSMARILYFHNKRLSKMRIVCGLPEVIPCSAMIEMREVKVKTFIDWDTFANWINKHDDLGEENLLTAKEYSDYLCEHCRDLLGRDGLLDLRTNKVIDYSKIVLV